MKRIARRLIAPALLLMIAPAAADLSGWTSVGFMTKDARQWSASGFTVEEGIAYGQIVNSHRHRGEDNLEAAKTWRRMGFSPDQAYLWLNDMGRSYEQARSAVAGGSTPAQLIQPFLDQRELDRARARARLESGGLVLAPPSGSYSPQLSTRISRTDELLDMVKAGHWPELVDALGAIGSGDDLSFFLAGRAAEGLGAYDRAIRYYEQSMAAAQRTGTASCRTSDCGWVRLPQSAQMRRDLVNTLKARARLLSDSDLDRLLAERGRIHRNYRLCHGQAELLDNYRASQQSRRSSGPSLGSLLGQAVVQQALDDSSLAGIAEVGDPYDYGDDDSYTQKQPDLSASERQRLQRYDNDLRACMDAVGMVHQGGWGEAAWRLAESEFDGGIDLGLPPADEPDFRSSMWGMTREEVIALEGMPDTDEDGRLSYDVNLGGIPGYAVFVFEGGYLMKTQYVLTPQHPDANAYVEDFQRLRSALAGKYGEAAQEERWREGSGKRPALMGDAVAQGMLTLDDNWETDRTVYNHWLYGGEGNVYHLIQYAARVPGLQSGETVQEDSTADLDDQL